MNGRFQADPVDALHPKSGNKKEKFYFIVSTLEGRSNCNHINVKLIRLNGVTPEGQVVLKVRTRSFGRREEGVRQGFRFRQGFRYGKSALKKQEERETGGTGCVTFLTLLQFPVRIQIIIAIIMLKYLLLPLLRRIMLREIVR